MARIYSFRPRTGVDASLTQRPMNNRDIDATWNYHDGTKHSCWSVRDNPHFLDWANRPQPFKIYPRIDPFPLPRDVPQTGVAAFSAISETLQSSRADAVPWFDEHMK